MIAELVCLLVLLTAVVQGKALQKYQLKQDELLNALLQRRSPVRGPQTEQVLDIFGDVNGGSYDLNGGSSGRANSDIQQLLYYLAMSIEPLKECQTKDDCVSRYSSLLVPACENGTCIFSLLSTNAANVDVESLQMKLNALKSEVSALERRIGQTYIRWGRTTCPVLNGTEFVYRGYMAGNKWNQPGGGSNHLCLPETPSWEKFVDGYNDGSEIRGTEIELDSVVSQRLFGREVHNQDISCSVCRSNRAAQVMIPGRRACYDGWILQYSGYVVAGKQTWAANSDYVCLDSGLEFVAGGAGDDEENAVKLVEVRLGSLPGPPYVEGRELPCVVCTK